MNSNAHGSGTLKSFRKRRPSVPLRAASLAKVFPSVVLFVAIPLSGYAQGPLAPPGAPAPSMKSLEQVEPRTPISTASFSISAPGSYYLTANLTGSFGIIIAANDVTLDLNGFAVTGSSNNVGPGIRVNAGHSNIEIRNGTISNWGQHGVDALAASNIRMFNIRSISNAQFATSHSGIFVGENSLIKTCMAEANSGGGIVALNNTRVIECMSRSNGFAGITISDRSRADKCVSSSNGGDGIRTGSWSVVIDCSAQTNFQNGIWTGTGSTISGCNSSFNGSAGILTASDCTLDRCLSYTNSFTGIRAGSGCVIRGCVATGNTVDGIDASAGSLISECTARNNGDDGITTGGATVSDCVASFNVGDGISLGSDCRVVDNTCFGNGNGGDGAGIRFLLGGSRIENNHVTDNDWGIKGNTSSTAGTLIVRNTASGNTGTASSGGADPHFDFNPTNNPHGVIEDVSGLAGGAITSSHVNRNWYY